MRATLLVSFISHRNKCFFRRLITIIQNHRVVCEGSRINALGDDLGGLLRLQLRSMKEWHPLEKELRNLQNDADGSLSWCYAGREIMDRHDSDMLFCLRGKNQSGLPLDLNLLLSTMPADVFSFFCDAYEDEDEDSAAVDGVDFTAQSLIEFDEQDRDDILQLLSAFARRWNLDLSFEDNVEESSDVFDNEEDEDECLFSSSISLKGGHRLQ